MFKKCGLIEKYGSGIRRIRKLCYEHGIIKSKFEELQKGFKATAFKKNLNEGVKSLLALISEEPHKRSTFFAQELNISVKNIERWIKQFKDEGRIEFRGSSKTGGYYAK